jgi:hypothetical protein
MATSQLAPALAGPPQTQGQPQTSGHHRKEVAGSWAQRHPWIVFAVAPIPLLVVTCMVYGAVVVGILALWKPNSESTVALQVLPLIFAGFLYVPASILAVALTWLIFRYQMKARWWFVAMLPTLFAASQLNLQYQLPTGPGSGRLNLGANLSPVPGNWLQCLIPLGIAACAGFALYQIRIRNSDSAKPV